MLRENKKLKESNQQYGYIWESSQAKTPKIVKLRPSSNKRSVSMRKSPNNLRSESPLETFPANECFGSYSSYGNRRLASPQENYLCNQVTEEIQISDPSYPILDKPSLERYEEEKAAFVIHTYARPRRLIAIKEKSPTKIYKKSRLVSTPYVRLGIAGWKLCQPKSFNPEFSFKRLRRKIHNAHLQVISTKYQMNNNH